MLRHLTWSGLLWPTLPLLLELPLRLGPGAALATRIFFSGFQGARLAREAQAPRSEQLILSCIRLGQVGLGHAVNREKRMGHPTDHTSDLAHQITHDG